LAWWKSLGSTGWFTVEVFNRGSDMANLIRVQDRVPPGYEIDVVLCGTSWHPRAGLIESSGNSNAR